MTQGTAVGAFIEGHQGRIERPAISSLYRAALSCVAIAMVILPVLYIALAAFAGWSVYELDRLLFDSGMSGRAFLFAFLGINGGLGVAVVFMFKPLFARRIENAAPYELRRTDQPLLFDFVDHLCDRIGAPRPVEIHLNCDANAGASFAGSVLALRRPALRLTLGLPFVVGLTMQQFAGVLAHEFGHFSQGTAMRLTHVIRSVNFWFARVVYERDAWDETLERRSSGGSLYIMVPAGIGRAAVWITRRVLWGLMTCGHAISCFALRQMEYDADACEAALAGSPAFASTMRRVTELGAAFQATHEEMFVTWRERGVVADMPRTIASRAAAFDADTLAKIHDAAGTHRSRLLATHPTDTDRIAAVARLDAPGVFHSAAPAEELFTGFDAVSRAVTTWHYERLFRDALPQVRVISLEEFDRGQKADNDAAIALASFFGDTLLPIRELTIGPIAPDSTLDAAAARRETGELIAAMEKARETAMASKERFDAVDDRMVELERGLGGAEASGTSADSLRQSLERLADEQRTVVQPLDEYWRMAERRLSVALGQGLNATSDLAAVLTALSALHAQADRLQMIRSHALRLQGVIAELNASPKAPPGAVNYARNCSRVLANLLQMLRRELSERDPFDESGKPRVLGACLVPDLPSADDIGQTWQAAQVARQIAYTTHQRLLARVCLAASNVELQTSNVEV